MAKQPSQNISPGNSCPVRLWVTTHDSYNTALGFKSFWVLFGFATKFSFQRRKSSFVFQTTLFVILSPIPVLLHERERRLDVIWPELKCISSHIPFSSTILVLFSFSLLSKELVILKPVKLLFHFNLSFLSRKFMLLPPSHINVMNCSMQKSSLFCIKLTLFNGNHDLKNFSQNKYMLPACVFLLKRKSSYLPK